MDSYFFIISYINIISVSKVLIVKSAVPGAFCSGADLKVIKKKTRMRSHK